MYLDICDYKLNIPAHLVNFCLNYTANVCALTLFAFYNVGYALSVRIELAEGCQPKGVVQI